MLEAKFTFDDFLKQLQQVRKMGPIADIMKMIPGMGGLAKQMPDPAAAERQMKQVEAIIRSMTMDERLDPTLINGSRRKRIAAGSGVTVSEVNALLKQFQSMQTMMKQFGAMAKRGKLPGMRM